MDNQTALTGGVIHPPELKFLDSGSAAASFSIAVDNGYMKSGEWVKKVSYFDVVAYGKLAENAAESLKSGYRVCVTGKMSQRSWTTEDDQKRYAIELIADDISVSLKFVTAEIHRPDGDKGDGMKASDARTNPRYGDSDDAF
jgi:single-strand DNA-binding protein